MTNVIKLLSNSILRFVYLEIMNGSIINGVRGYEQYLNQINLFETFNS